MIPLFLVANINNLIFILSHYCVLILILTSKRSPENARHPNGRHNSPLYPNGRLNPRTAFHAVFQPKHPNAPLK